MLKDIRDPLLSGKHSMNTGSGVGDCLRRASCGARVGRFGAGLEDYRARPVTINRAQDDLDAEPLATGRVRRAGVGRCRKPIRGSCPRPSARSIRHPDWLSASLANALTASGFESPQLHHEVRTTGIGFPSL
jgi:hypothetical protein